MIDKSHSKNDLIEIINTLNLRVVFNHSDNKNSIQNKLKIFIDDKPDIKIEKNIYDIHDLRSLSLYLKNKNPKKYLNVKEKNNIMFICKNIIKYCKAGYCIHSSSYNDEQEIIDDMNYIKQYGDVPSCRRCCKLMNENKGSTLKYIPLISPQVQKQLQQKENQKKKIIKGLIVKEGQFKLYFD